MLRNNLLDTTMTAGTREAVVVAEETKTEGLLTIKDAMTGVTARKTT